MTNMRIILWALCAVISISVHASALFALGVLLRPEPPEQQKMMHSQLEIEAQDVPRSKADEKPAESKRVASREAFATAAPETPVTQSKAIPAEPTATAAPETPVTQSKTIPAEPTATAAPETPVTQSKTIPAKPTATSLTSAIAKGKLALASNHDPVKTASLAPNSVKTSTTPLPNNPVDTAAPDTDSGQEVAPTPSVAFRISTTEQSGNALVLELPSEPGKATLAWSGAGETQVDPVSVAAIQAFMQPGDLTQSDSAAGRVRDGIEVLLYSVPCARLQTTFIPETGSLELRGHLPEDALREPVLEALKAQVGTAIPVSDNLLILPRPQCGALSGIADIGLPQSTEQLTNSRVVGPDGFARNFTYTNGQRLSLELTAPDYDALVYVDYFTADGMVIHLQPNEFIPIEQHPAKALLTVGADRGDKPSLDITISPPFGQEIAAAFATSTPLYSGVRPMVEPAEPYLDFLKSKVTKARENNPDFKGEWVYFFISTKEN